MILAEIDLTTTTKIPCCTCIARYLLREPGFRYGCMDISIWVLPDAYRLSVLAGCSRAVATQRRRVTGKFQTYGP